MCNIGPAEIARRRHSGWLGAAATVIGQILLAGAAAATVVALLAYRL